MIFSIFFQDFAKQMHDLLSVKYIANRNISPRETGFALKYMYIKCLIQRFQYATFEYDIPDGVIKAKS